MIEVNEQLAYIKHFLKKEKKEAAQYFTSVHCVL